VNLLSSQPLGNEVQMECRKVTAAETSYTYTCNSFCGIPDLYYFI